MNLSNFSIHQLRDSLHTHVALVLVLALRERRVQRLFVLFVDVLGDAPGAVKENREAGDDKHERPDGEWTEPASGGGVQSTGLEMPSKRLWDTLSHLLVLTKNSSHFEKDVLAMAASPMPVPATASIERSMIEVQRSYGVSYAFSSSS